jgi:hypothetical protein
VTEVPDDEARNATRSRKDGITYAEIAEQFGLSSPQEAKQVVMKALNLPSQELGQVNDGGDP